MFQNFHILVKAQSQKYDSKKNVWIPDSEEGYIAAEIESTEGEHVTVILSKGDKVRI